jgi:hypothetical protein
MPALASIVLGNQEVNMSEYQLVKYRDHEKQEFRYSVLNVATDKVVLDSPSEKDVLNFFLVQADKKSKWPRIVIGV